MGSMSIWHWVIVAAIVMLLFGRGRISDLMGDVANGIKAFKRGLADDEVPSGAIQAALVPGTDAERAIGHGSCSGPGPRTST